MNEREIKESWRRSSEMLESENTGRRYGSRKNTSLARLAERYKRFSTLALVFAFIGPMCLNKLESGQTCRIIMIVWYSGTMLLSSLIDRYLYKRVSEIDIYEMTPVEVLEKAMECRKVHLKSICFLLPLGLGLIAFIAWISINEIYFMWGIAAGAVIGVIIGIFQLQEFMRDYRDLRKG